ETDRRFRRRHRHHEERDDLTVEIAGGTPEGDEREIHGVQHDLDRQQDRDQIAPQEHTCRADREEQRRQHEVIAQRNHRSPSRPPRAAPGGWARITAPTMATRIRIEVASNANVWRVKSERPNSVTELTVVASAFVPTGIFRSAILARARPSCTMSSPASSVPQRVMPG